MRVRWIGAMPRAYGCSGYSARSGACVNGLPRRWACGRFGRLSMRRCWTTSLTSLCAWHRLRWFALPGRRGRQRSPKRLPQRRNLSTALPSLAPRIPRAFSRFASTKVSVARGVLGRILKAVIWHVARWIQLQLVQITETLSRTGPRATASSRHSIASHVVHVVAKRFKRYPSERVNPFGPHSQRWCLTMARLKNCGAWQRWDSTSLPTSRRQPAVLHLAAATWCKLVRVFACLTTPARFIRPARGRVVRSLRVRRVASWPAVGLACRADGSRAGRFGLLLGAANCVVVAHRDQRLVVDANAWAAHHLIYV